jgi:hypothetical protein
MAVNEFEEVDYLEQARSRVTEQFKNKPVFDKFLQLLLHGQEELQGVFKDLMQLRSVDTATGAQLDLIGNIVGQERTLIEAEIYKYFAMQGVTDAQTFGDLNISSAGGWFYDLGQSMGGNVKLDDITYRKFIKAKIYKNVTACTPEEYIKIVKLIFDVDQIYIYEDTAGLLVYFGRGLTSFEKALLNYVTYTDGYPSRLLPKPVGVSVKYGEFQSNNYFGFQGASGVKGFGDINKPSVGGTFATLY